MQADSNQFNKAKSTVLDKPIPKTKGDVSKLILRLICVFLFYFKLRKNQSHFI